MKRVTKAELLRKVKQLEELASCYVVRIPSQAAPEVRASRSFIPVHAYPHGGVVHGEIGRTFGVRWVVKQ